VNRVHQLPIIALVVTIVAMVALSTLTAVQGCHTQPVADIVDCAKQDGPQLAGEFAKLSAMIPDWAKIYDTAASDIATVGWQIAGCVIADLAQQYLTKKGAALSIEETWSAHNTLDHYRTTKAHGATFRVRGNNL
jgi:hypothetical protein